MLIISFAWTTAALLATEEGRDVKTCTRRSWNDGYARLFKAGTKAQAWDRSPRFKGDQVAVISLTQDAYLESTSMAPDEDYRREGLEWMEKQGIMIPVTYKGRKLPMSPRQFWEQWKAADELVYVVRFQVMQRLAPVGVYLHGERTL